MVVKIGSVVEFKYLDGGKIIKKNIVSMGKVYKAVSTPNYTHGKPTEESLGKDVGYVLEKDEISVVSPVGKALLGKRKNEVIKITKEEDGSFFEIKIISIDNSQVDETDL